MLVSEVQRPGIYRRHIRIRSGPGEVRADMEDDSHRFGVIVRHDGRSVTEVQGLPMRTPWTLCPDAASVLPGLVGMALAPSPLAAAKHIDAKQQCTHMFDLASLAIAHAARGTALREYAVEAPWYKLADPRTMTLRRDGVEVWTWTLDGMGRITAPEPYASVDVRRLQTWAEANVSDLDELEAVFIMRRAVMISGSRIMDLDPFPHPAATGHGIGACYVHHPDRIAVALRNVGSTRDFTDRPEGPLADISNKEEKD